jgi:hypothetical protein
LKIEISKQEVMNLLLEACPSYKNRWLQYYKENYDNGDEQLLYIDLTDFAYHFIDLFKHKQIREFPRIFEVIELLHTDGDDFVKEAATIGLLEDIQNLALGEDINPDVFKQYLKSETLKWWNNLDDFWNGKTKYVGGPKK